MKQAKRPVTVEDLLRLKRAERPQPEFWNDFDRQLRAKQLAALVEKRPWWHSWPRALSRLSRMQVAGAAAVLVAVVAVAKRDVFVAPKPVQTAHVAVAPAPVATTAMLPVTTRAAVAREMPNAGTSRDAAVHGPSDTDAAVTKAPSRTVAAATFESGANEAERISSLEAVTATNLEVAPATPSARFIAANFAAVQSADSGAVPLLANSHGFESRALPSRSAVEPLQHVSPPGETRRSTRYLAAMVTMTFDERAPQTTERAASRISPDELYDQVRRFGTRHGGLNVKF